MLTLGRGKTVRLLGALAVLSGAMVVVAPSPAHADRCQPEELTPIGPGGSPVDERDNPVCVALDTYVYPLICPDNQPKPLGACLQTLRLNPSYRPPLFPTYQPDVGRIYCGIWNFVLPPTCTN